MFLSLLLKLLLRNKKVYAVAIWNIESHHICDSKVYLCYEDAVKRALKIRDKHLEEAEETMHYFINHEHIQNAPPDLKEYRIKYEKSEFEKEKKRFSGDDPKKWEGNTLKWNLSIEEYDLV